MLYLNHDPVKVTLFPDNTSQIWKLDESHFNQERVDIRWEFSHEGEVMHLAQLKNLLDFYGVERTYLHIDYLPYGRQDKWIDNNSTFALCVFAPILNSLYFEEVVILDPHSLLALKVVNKSKAIYPHEPLRNAAQATRTTMLCYPDDGALSKYVNIYNAPLPYIHGKKVRDQATGYISEYHLIGECAGERVLIVDDICDGGKTFEFLARDLLKGGAEEVNLFVTHGLFTKGLRPLKTAGIKQIFTNKGEAISMRDGGFCFRKP